MREEEKARKSNNEDDECGSEEDSRGNEIPISDLWKDRKAIVAFARHFGDEAEKEMEEEEELLLSLSRRKQMTEFKRIVSPLKYQTRCVTAFPDQQDPDGKKFDKGSGSKLDESLLLNQEVELDNEECQFNLRNNNDNNNNKRMNPNGKVGDYYAVAEVKTISKMRPTLLELYDDPLAFSRTLHLKQWYNKKRAKRQDPDSSWDETRSTCESNILQEHYYIS
ncbi:unnamed protein product [Brassica oleracea var. botrytis]|uniref:Uncharacterized protein n=2 Tax=Brassica TaxID=3705 RepID=A0A3P6EMK9_BRAOL|nr:unnamed protein product [Brassica napus]CDY12847.1 BnaC07g15860D [Brassica napus]VDD37381.1 unnamed protein product [Brassica oleracea]